MSVDNNDSKLDYVISLLKDIKGNSAISIYNHDLNSESNSKIMELETSVSALTIENDRLRKRLSYMENLVQQLVEENEEEILSPCGDVQEGTLFVSNESFRGCVLSDKINVEKGEFVKTPFVLKSYSSDVCSISTAGRYIMSTPSTLNVVRLCWEKNCTPQRVLLLKKIGNDAATLVLRELVIWFSNRGIEVYVEPNVFNEVGLSSIFTWKEEDKYDVNSMVDFVVTLGGDGTLLYASSLFPKTVPPVISFHMGTLGFLTPFCADEYEKPLNRMILGDVPMTIRSRLEYHIIRYDETEPISHKSKWAVDFMTHDEKADTNLKILNDIVIDRGTSSSMVELNCYIDSTHITTVHADGLIIATPTGSTAYSMSAGGSMVHPLTPGILMTPICPHTLSFRQMLFPDNTILRIEVSLQSRCVASVSFDGQFKESLNQGDALIIRTSRYPVPSVCPDDGNNNWFRSVRDGLHWNKATSSLIESPKS